MLDVVDRNRESALRVGDDPVRHLLRRKTVVIPHHTDHGDIDFGEDVDRRARDRDRHQDDDQQGHHHEGIRTAKR